MRIIDQPRPILQGGTVQASAHQFMIQLALGEKVRCGTPIRPGPNGWEVDPTGENAYGFAASSATGPERVGAWRSMTLEFARDIFPPASLAPYRCSLADVDDLGNLSFKLDPQGPYAVLAPHRVLLVPAR